MEAANNAIEFDLTDSILDYFDPIVYKNYYVLKKNIFEKLVYKKVYPFSTTLLNLTRSYSSISRKETCQYTELFLDYIIHTKQNYGYKTIILLIALLQLIKSNDSYFHTKVTLYKTNDKCFIWFLFLQKMYFVFNLKRLDEVIMFNRSLDEYNDSNYHNPSCLCLDKIETVDKLSEFNLSSFWKVKSNFYRIYKEFSDLPYNNYLNVLYSILYSYCLICSSKAEYMSCPDLVKELYSTMERLIRYSYSSGYLGTFLGFISDKTIVSNNNCEIVQPAFYKGNVSERDIRNYIEEINSST